MTPDATRRALITGASSGIGKSTAIAFAQAGIDVALVSRSQDRLEAIAQDLGCQGVVAKAYGIDLAQVAQVSAQMQAVLADFGPIDILVNNAGMGYTGGLADMPLADWQRVLDLNLTSVFQCIQALLPGLRDRNGTIVNVVSIAGKSAFPNWGAYSVSKASILTLSRILAAEERQHGVRVTAISPGAVNTPIWDTETVQADFDRASMLTPDVVAQTILHAVQLPAQAVIEDLNLMPSAGAL
ncbi:short-chain dehydrogenase family oxidoreductase [Halomicronema hongdechloris C2206]|uniref:Short-chain dehydrogenase family oxidoreductase n=1 Tax=Halomicronema hongdechloris C2206 TaxID=1641165 RepID=A0A1Z3HUV0_9CYAN|nr:SDR family oxidoreductase [Halomicronema hongdechloris]ASC74063.1 short-chain dehydrogenase family oxidoreductase [Halomicronema hongdechloris C2206]